MPTDAEIQAAAKAVYDARHGTTVAPWHCANSEHRAQAHHLARAALSAAEEEREGAGAWRTGGLVTVHIPADYAVTLADMIEDWVLDEARNGLSDEAYGGWLDIADALVEGGEGG